MNTKKLSRLVPSGVQPVLADVYNFGRGLIYTLFAPGSTYHCPFCKRSYRKFVPSGYKPAVLQEQKIIGGGWRPNVECPACGSMDRERLVYLFLQSRSLLQPGTRVLHIAPEKNLQKLISKTVAEYISADIDSSFATIKMDIQQIDFPGEYFDAIICNHVLEHIIDDALAMRELYRVLKKGGWAILQVPYSPVLQETFEDPKVISEKDRENVFGQSDHVRIYGRDYPQRLQQAGFTVSQEQLDADTTKKFALNPDEAIFFCRK